MPMPTQNHYNFVFIKDCDIQSDNLFEFIALYGRRDFQ